MNNFNYSEIISYFKSKLKCCTNFVFKMARNSCFFNDKLKAEYVCMEPVNGKPNSTYCNVCKEEFSIKNKGRFDIEQHLKTQRHRNNSKLTTKDKLFHYFHKKGDTEEDYKLARMEITWIYHNVMHNHSFRSMDCTSKLLKKFVDPKISCARTKTQAAVTNVISTWTDDMLLKELETCHFVIIACDASNHNAIKLLPVLLRLVEDGSL